MSVSQTKGGRHAGIKPKTTESIHLGDSVVVTVLEIRSNRVRIGIDAPKEVRVLRSELQDVISSKLPKGSELSK